MNAISKGVAIGIYDSSKKNGVDASKGGSQPYVDIMGRRYASRSPTTACVPPPTDLPSALLRWECTLGGDPLYGLIRT